MNERIRTIRREAAQHGLRAHMLYQAARDARRLAIDLKMLGECERSARLARDARALDGKRRRLMAQ